MANQGERLQRMLCTLICSSEMCLCSRLPLEDQQLLADPRWIIGIRLLLATFIIPYMAVIRFQANLLA